MKKLLTTLFSLVFLFNVNSFANETLDIKKQLVGIVGAISGVVKTETRELKTGDKIYLNETIISGANSGTQILLLDQSTFTVGEDSEVVMDTFIYDPATSDGKIVASVKQGSLKVISGLISKKNPENLTVEVPEGTLGSRGTEFQTIVSKGKTDTLLIPEFLFRFSDIDKIFLLLDKYFNPLVRTKTGVLIFLSFIAD